METLGLRINEAKGQADSAGRVPVNMDKMDTSARGDSRPRSAITWR
jgi:hypothetical protein